MPYVKKKVIHLDNRRLKWSNDGNTSQCVLFERSTEDFSQTSEDFSLSLYLIQQFAVLIFS